MVSEFCVFRWYGVVHGSSNYFEESLSEWIKDKPLSILQLDPADRAVLRIADERDAIQKKTFTKWVNKHLKKANKEVYDLFEDLRDGHNLISLLEVLSNEILPREKGNMRFHMLQNVQIALDFLRFRKIKLVNIRAEDIVDGNPKLTLGLIWTIILHFQISDIITHQTDERITAKEALLRWARRTTDKYPSVRITDFTSSWRDGLAFNAIIHRNRPDLVDYRQCLKRTARDNLDSAFTIAERELSVTKLLDPEDVDTPEPDEKSLITYISSLYDVFPRPPSYNAFAHDDEKVRKLEEYRDMSSSLLIWMRDALSMLQDRNFPNTLVEMKSLLAECTRFRVEDVPPRLHEKQRLAHVYRELQKLFRDSGSFDISDELRIENIERYWNRVMNAHQERDQAIHDEIARLEKLQRLAEKVHRETKQCDGRLDDVERHIAEEEKRIQRLHPADSKHNCDQIENELKHIEESLKSMAKDVQTLRDGRYHQAPELHKRVQQLHERYLNIRTNFQTRLLSLLAARALKAEERKTPKPRPVSLEKLIETNKAFKFLQECIDWVHGKLKSMEEADYGTDLPSAQALLEQHHTEHRLIDQFHKNVDQCAAQKSQFKGEEFELYCKLLSRLEKSYSELLILSNKRMSDLEILLDFIKSATDELIWMNEKEEIEVSRDWSSSTLNVLDLEQYQKVFTSDLERRERQFNSVHDHGQSLILQRHPAAKCIEAYLSAMQSQWSWLLQLLLCLEIHLKHASVYHQFFSEAKECQQWLKKIEDKLNTTYSRQNFSIDEGERLMKEMQELRDDLSHYSNVVSALIERSKDIVPLRQRRQPLPRPLRVTAVCSYKHHSMSVAKDEHCWLHDNSQKTKWRIINSNGMEGMVPGVCFLIPPPNPEALELAESLKKQFELIVNLWTSKQRKLRQNMIFATIKIIKSWDITKFRSIEPSQRESIIKALNEDTQKLLNEGSSDDPALKRLQEEIAYCNKLFADLQRMLDQDEIDRISKTQARKFNDMVSSVQNTLTEKERTLKQRTQASIPRSKHLVDELMQEHKEFESELQAFEPRVSEVREAFRELNNKTPALQSRHDAVMESWNNLWSMSSLYVERLKSVEVAISHYEEASQVVSNVELKLISYDDMPSDIESLAKVEQSLLSLKREMHHQQGTVDRMTEDVANVRHLVELSRPHQVVHTDVSKFEEDSRKVRRRWDQAAVQIQERLRAVETSTGLLKSYESKAEEQKAWISQMNVKVESMKAVSHMDTQEMHREVESTMSMYTTVGQRKAVIEEVNVDGGRFLREAKIYDLQLKHYKEGLEDIQLPADESVPKKAKVLSGAEVISQELDTLNQQYSDLANALLQRLNELKSILSSQEGQKYSVTIIQAPPIILKTFRTELIFELPSTSSYSDYFSSVEPQAVHLYQNSSTVNCMPGYESSSLSRSFKKAVPIYPLGSKANSNSVFTSEVNIDIDSSHDPVLVDVARNKNLSGSTITFSNTLRTRHMSEKSCIHESFVAKRFIEDCVSRERLTLSRALNKNILSLSPLGYLNPLSQQFLDLEEAVSYSLIDNELAVILTNPAGIFYPNTQKELNLAEAIQKGLYNPCSGNLQDPVTKHDISMSEALSLNIVKKERLTYLIQNRILNIPNHSLLKAIQLGLLDCKTGMYKSSVLNEPLTLQKAFKLGFLDAEISRYAECGISLAEAVQKGLVDEQKGLIIDRDSNEWCTAPEALKREILAAKYTGIGDSCSSCYVSVEEALNSGILDPTKGKYFDIQARKYYSFKEACEKKLIVVPFTLRDAYLQGIYDDSGYVLNPLSGEKLTLLEALKHGIFNAFDRCILCADSEEMLTIPEALVYGVLTPEGFIVDRKSGNMFKISEAATRGYLASVSHKSVFEIEGFQDTASGEFVNFLTAHKKGIIDLNLRKFKDLNTGRLLSFQDATELRLIQPQMYDMLTKKIGVNFGHGKQKTLLDCVCDGDIDPCTGKVIDPQSRCSLTLLQAIDKGLITEEAAVDLKSLMNITVTLTCVTTETTRYVTVMKTGVNSDSKISFKEAFMKGLIDEAAGTFRDPSSGNVIPLEEAIVKGLIGVTAGSSLSPCKFTDTDMDTRDDTSDSEPQILKSSVNIQFRGTTEMQELRKRSENGHVIADDTLSSEEEFKSVDKQKRQSILFSKIVSYPKITKQEQGTMVDIDKKQESENDKASFESVFFLVKEASGGYVTYGEAEKYGLIDKNTGEYCDKIRGKRLSLEEAKLQGLLIPFASLEFDALTTDLQGILEIDSPKVASALQSSEEAISTNTLLVNEASANELSSSTVMNTCKEVEESSEKCHSEHYSRKESVGHDQNEVKQTKSNQYTIPRFEVKIGRAQTVDSPAKAVVLQKVRRKRMKPSLAVKKGLVDKETAKVLDDVETMKGPDGEPVSLKDAVSLNMVDGNQGAIANPKSSDFLTINEAMVSGVLDPESGQLMLPIGRSLSIPEAVTQGLVEPVQQKILHPEHGDRLTIQEAIVCDIIDPLSEMTEPTTGENLTLEKAIDIGVIDCQTSEVQLWDSKVSILEAVDLEIFKNSSAISDLFPPLALTFPVALSHGFIDVSSKEYIHPIEKERIPLEKAFERGLIMIVPVDPMEGNIDIWTAFDQKLIDPILCTFKKPSSSELMTVAEAVESGILQVTSKRPSLFDIGKDVDSKSIMSEFIGKYFLLQDLLKNASFNQTSFFVRDLDKNRYSLGSENGKALVESNALVKVHPNLDLVVIANALDKDISGSPFDIKIVSEAEIYDPHTSSFIKPVTKQKISFEDLFSLGILEQSSVFVKDSENQSFCPVIEAIGKGIINKNTGELTSPTDGNKITCFEGSTIGAIISVKQFELTKPPKCVSLEMAIKTKLFDLKEVALKLPGTSFTIPLNTCLLYETIDPTSVQIFDGKNKLFSLSEAIDNGLIDLTKNIYIHPLTKQEMNLEIAFRKGFIFAKRKPMSLEAALKQNLYNSSSGSFIDPVMSVKMDIEQAVCRSLIDSSLTLVKDTKLRRTVNLDEALGQRVIIAKSGKLRDTASGSLMTLDVALKKGLIRTASMQLSLIDAIEQCYYEAEKGVFNPLTGEYVSLSAAIATSFINPISVVIKDVMSGKFITLKDAVSQGVITESGKLLVPGSGLDSKECVFVDLKQALECGSIQLAEKPFHFQQAMEMRLFNSVTGRFTDPSTNRDLDLQQALSEGLLRGETALLKTPGCLKTLTVSVQDKVINVDDGTVSNDMNKSHLDIETAFKQHVIVPVDGSADLRSIVEHSCCQLDMEGFNTFELTLDEAMNSKCINLETAVIKDLESHTYRSLKDAVKEGLVEVKNKVVFHITRKIPSQTAVYSEKLLIFQKSPKSLESAICDKSFNVITAKFTDSESKQRLSLLEAMNDGLVDSGSAVIKDTAHKRLLSLHEGFEAEVLDSDKGTILNTESKQVLTFKDALKLEVLLLPSHKFLLTEAIECGLFATDSNTFLNPFTHAHVTCEDAISCGFLTVSSVSVRDPGTDEFLALPEAIEKGILDAKKSLLLNSISGKSMNLLDAYQGGFIMPTAKRVAIEEKYRLYVDNTSNLLSWLHEVETQLADLGLVREDADDLHRQISMARAIKQDIDDHQRAVTTCLDQVQQLIEDGKDVLGREEIHYLQKNSDSLKKRFVRASDESDKLLRRLNAAFDELRKFSNELIAFMEWMKEAHVKQTDKERSLGDLERLKEHADSFKAFSSDAIAHQADLRFITMAAQKFIDESKDYLKVLNDFRTNLPHRLSHIEPGESEVKAKVQDVSSAFQSLLSRIERLGERFSMLTSRQRDFTEYVEKASNWLNSVQKNAKKLIDEPVAADPRAVQDQLDRVKAVSIEIVQQGRLIDSVKTSANALLLALEDADASPADRRLIEEKVKHLEDEYNRISNAINGKSNDLQMALIHSQDIQDGLDRLLKWLDDIENTLRSQNRPVSLIKEKMDEQIQEHKLLLSDIDGQKPTIDAMNESARGLLDSSNHRLAKKIENKLKEVNVRFEKLCEKAQKRSDQLEEVCKVLGMFQAMANRFEEWLSTVFDTVQGKDMETSDLTVIEDIINQRDARRDSFEEIMRSGKNLVSKRDVTDTGVIKEKMKSIEQLWKDLSDLLTEKHRRNKEMAEQLAAYEALRNKVLEWLSNMETRVESLEPVALDKETLRRQAMEIKPLMKEHADYAPTIDRVNVLGNNYEVTLRGETPGRRAGSPVRRSGMSSPTRTSPPKLRRSPDFTSQVKSPYSSISSGFGSARSSTDNIGNIEDLSPVQQQLSEINHRYSLLGIRLSDRSQEINAFTDEIRVCFDSLKNLAAFVQAKERQLPRDAVPVTKDGAAKQLLALKSIQDEMHEKQLEMDRLKAQTLDLVKRKPNASGIDSLQQQVLDVASRWNELQSAVKQRSQLLQDMKDFQDAYDSLINWLGQKEKMFQVLGPIASEPRMVTSQIQQLQVLRDEFTAQEPLVHRFRDRSHFILDHIEPGSQGAKKIREQVQNVNTRWDELLGKLADRERSLDAASGATKDFQDSLNRLQDRLQHIADEFDHLSEAGSDAEDQLRKLMDLEDQLEDQRPLLADADVMCNHLCDILSDSASKSEIKSKLGGVEKQYNNLNRKINNRKAELESSLREDRDFHYSFDRIQQWLNDMENTLAKSFPVSAEQDILQRQVLEFESVYKEVLGKDHEIHMLMSKGAEMLPKITRKAEAAQLQSKMDATKRQWEKVRKAATDRHTHLQKCSENCRKYNSAVENFMPWLNRSIEKLNELEPISFHRAQLDKQVKEIQTFKNDLSKHSQDYEHVRHSGDVLVMCCDVDTDTVKNELESIKRRWDHLNQGVFERAQALEDISHKLSLYQDKARDAHHSLNRLEDRLHSHDALGDSSRDPKLLARMKAMLAEADGVQKQLDSLKDYADRLIAEASPSVDTSHITDEVEELAKRHKHLMRILEDKCSDLESASEIVSHFNNKMKDGHHHLSNLDEELDNMAPIGRDIDTVHRQIDEIKNYLRRLKKSRDEFEELEHNCQDIISHGYSPDPKGCRNQLDVLHRQLIRLEERAKQRDSNLENMLSRLEKFYEDYNDISMELNDTMREEHTFKAIGGEVDTIRSQQEQFKTYRRDRLEPLARHIEGINKVGQGLIQSAAPGVNTSILEQDLDALNERWNSLKQKMNERERRLDSAFLQSGKFLEALDGVQKWLEDTEELVANQKPPSADYKVVKAQLQEQKFLNKLLMDRQSNMESLMAMGHEVMSNMEPLERNEIEAQLNDLMQRFEELKSAAQDRTDALEHTIPVAKDFQDKMAPLVEWLEQVEKKLAVMATIPSDQEKIRRRMVEHEALHEDIMDHKEAFEELTEIAQTLMSLVGDDEAQVVVDKLQEVTNHYAKVVEDSEHIGQLLAEAFQGVGSFTVNYEDLMAWINEMASRLSRFHTLSVQVEKLQEQLDELVELSEEISDHQKQVDDVATAGQEIMKHASGDDVICMKEKLDTLSIKFTDLTSRAADRLRQAQDALPLVQNFHSSHKRVSSWMDSAERQLKGLETIGLTSQENTIQRLESEIQENRPLVDTLNHLGPQLCQMSPGEGAAVIESEVTKVNRRFDSICEQVQRKAERIDLSKQRNIEVVSDIEDLLDWFHEVEKQLLQAEPLTADPEALAVLLKKQKALNDEVSSQKGRVRDILSAAKKLMRESSGEDLAEVRMKADELKDIANTVSSLCSDRLSALEQALPLAEHFFETHLDLCQWLDEMETEAALQDAPALNAYQIKKQQDRNKALMQSVNEHKPLLDKLNKTGAALKKLCSPVEGSKVQKMVDSDNSRYNALKDTLRDRQNALEEAMQATSQFSDKLDGMLNSLSNTADQLNNAEPVSAHPEKIQEQLSENKAVLKDLDKRSNALEAVKRAADDVIIKAGNARDPAVRDIKQKLDKLNDLWDSIQKLAHNRGRSLEDALAAAERFWDELTMVMKTLNELQESLNAQEPPAVEPAAIQHQQDVLQEIKQEIEQTKPEVDQCRQAGQDLMQLCGEPDKPEVKKHIEDLDSVWENVTTLYAKREQNLIDAMEKAMNFHDVLQSILEFLDYAEDKFAGLGPIGSDIQAVKGQIMQLKDFKNEVDPHMVEVESINRQAHELMERTSPSQAKAIREPLAEINKRWDDLLKGIVDRQTELENALLRLGQFQHALDEFLVWISKTEKTLDDLRPVFGDPQVIEVELAKHKVLMNDIQAHQTSVDTLNRAGRQLIEANRGSEDASVTQNKLNNLNKRWQHLQDKASERQSELEEALKEAQIFNQEIQDLLMWLSDIDSQLVSSKPVGGLPETAREQLNRFMELYNDLDSNKHKVDGVLTQGQNYLKRSNEGAATNLQHSLRTLKQRWENVLNRANDRKIKLEIALREATEFHEALQDFVEWLTNAEKFLSNLKPVSRVMDSVLEQIEEHKTFQKEVASHREVMLNLDKKGTHLKYFSQKQDVILIKNLLISVQHRWERVVSKAAERTRSLDHGYKEAKEFHDAWSDLSKWLDEAEKSLDVSTHVGNDPEKIKQMLAKHKEFQRTLGAKQPLFDGTMKLGRSLKEKCPKADVPVLQGMLDDLKNKWNNVCSKSVDRQRKLEEALLFSGQFKDAVQALIDWLEKSKVALSENQLLHGDLDTVMALVDQHKTFQDELKNRANNLESVRRTAKELLESASPEDADHIRQQIQQLDTMWFEVAKLSDDKQRRLEEALHEAERLHKAVHMLLEWLSDAEMKLRFAGPLPDDEETTKQQIEDHQRFMKDMAEQEINKDTTIEHAQDILKKCHPDGVSVIRHWITIIQSRWEEVSLWAKQREQRLNDHLRSLRDVLDLLEELLAWLIGAEASLTALEAEPLPDEIPLLEQLIVDHQVFMDDMNKRQPDVERVTKAFQSKRQPQQPPSKEKGRERHESAQDRKSGRGTPCGKAPARQAFEPDIKNPRARELVEKWRHVWLLAMERQRRLEDKLNYMRELERIKNFDFDEWRRKFLAWMNNKKSRVMDLFRKIDKDNDGKVTHEEFIEGILKSKFPTSRLEMERVAEIFDRNGDGFIDHKEYIDTLRPDREKGPLTEAEKIQDEVQRQVAQCTCVHRFKVYQVGEGKYRFGESQKLRLVRILRSTVMVRVGGGWVALDEFLVKNDPCRAKGRTNLELREQFILAEGVSQSLQPFKPKASPGSSQSSQSGGSSFNRSGILSSTGPITKVREKSERSVPMRQQRSHDSSSDGTSFSEADSSFGSRSARSHGTPNRLTPAGNRPGSRPSSRPSSRPPSRAASDLTGDHLDNYRSRKLGSTGARQRTPSASSQTSGRNGATPSPGTKIPTIKRTPSYGSSANRPEVIVKKERERWK